MGHFKGLPGALWLGGRYHHQECNSEMKIMVREREREREGGGGWKGQIKDYAREV